MSTALTVPNTTEMMRQATDVAGVCKAIALKSSIEIQGRKYVRVEGWMSIATAHGCIASARDVEKVEGGFRAIGEIRRISDGAVLTTAEGFVGEDEPTWFGGVTMKWNKIRKVEEQVTLVKRPDYAIRAMTQTRAISRACRTAFAHVVVLMDAGLSTTPAEEVPIGGFNDEPAPKNVTPAPIGTPVEHLPTAASANTAPADDRPANGTHAATDWRLCPVPKFVKKGAYIGMTVGDMPEKDIRWWAANFTPKEFRGKIQQGDMDFRKALTLAAEDLDGRAQPATVGAPAELDVPF